MQNEKLLHALLKKYYLAPGGAEEVREGRSICDLRNPDGAVEIQTGSTYPLVPKLRALLPLLPVTATTRSPFAFCARRYAFASFP